MHVQSLMCVSVSIVRCVSLTIFNFNVIISPVTSVQLKTHPSTDNTPLSIRGTETQTHRVHSEDTLITTVDLDQTWGLSVGPVAFQSLLVPESRLHLDPHWSHPGSSVRDCCRIERRKHKSPFVRTNPAPTWQITQSEDVAGVHQVNLTDCWERATEFVWIWTAVFFTLLSFIAKLKVFVFSCNSY